MKIENLSGILQIKLTKPTYRIGRLYNEFADKNAKIKSIDFHFDFGDEECYEEPIKEIYKQIAIKAKSINIKSETDQIIKFIAPNGKYFTFKDLEKIVKTVEKKTRGNTEWFGGIDCHHIFFEGIHKVKKGLYQLHWGS